MDLNEQSQICSQSLMLKSKPSPVRTWLQKWKKDTWTQHLSSRILKPSLGKTFVESWISSLGVSRVSHLAKQESEMQTQTSDTSSHTFWKELENADLPLFTLKMLKESSQQNSQEMDGETPKEHQFCSMSSENWKEWVTKQRQEFSQRVKSEHLIREKESLSWGTPNTMDCLPSRSYEAMKRQATTGGRKNRKRPGNLREQVDPLMCQAYQDASSEANWGTPRASEHYDSGPVGSKSHTHQLKKGYLSAQTKQWATPTAMEADKAGYYEKGQMGQSLSAMAKRGELCGHQDQDNHNTGGNLRESLQWRTPTAQEAGAKVETLYTKDGQPAKVGQRAYRKTPKGEMVLQSQTINQQVEIETKQPSMRLNPRWVETLMGLPVGWCMPSCANPVTLEMMNSDYLATE